MTERWRHGDISNFEYLMLLNNAAGSVWAMPPFALYSVVTDFVRDENLATQEWNLRDLAAEISTQKGDAQLTLHTRCLNRDDKPDLSHHIPGILQI